MTLAQQTYDRVKELAGSRQRAVATARRGHEFASRRASGRGPGEVRLSGSGGGATKEEREIAHANVAKAQARRHDPRAGRRTRREGADRRQVYQIGAELGEYVSPGVPLLSLVDLGDVWLRFDLREDLVQANLGRRPRSRCGRRRSAIGRSPRSQTDRRQRGIRGLAGDPRHRGFRPQNVRGARLPGPAHPRASAGNERLRHRARGEPVMKRPRGPDCCASRRGSCAGCAAIGWRCSWRSEFP